MQGQEINNNEGGSWYTITNKFKVTENLYFSNVIQWRLVEFATYTRVFLVVPGVNYRFNNKMTAGVGYNYTNYSLVGIRPANLDYENRVYQHVTLFSTFVKIRMNQRLVFEQRFKTSINGDETYSNRLRYRINFEGNLFNLKNDKYILGQVSNELRIRFSKGISDPVFDQNNFVVSFGYQLLENSKFYLGYRRDYYNAGSGIYWGDHILNLMLSYDFDFTK